MLTACAVSLGLGLAQPAAAQDEDVELWLNPSAGRAVSDRTSVEIETVQRLRRSPRDDTYYIRAWLNHDDARDTTWSVGVEHRWNGPDQREVRLLQQVGYSLGPVDFRTRLEQRFLSDDPDTGWRLRQRVGTDIPLGDGDGWTLVGNAEFIMTLQATDPAGQTGLTGLRTFVGFEREIGRYDVSLGYIRQQDIRDNAEDRIGHAPFIGVSTTF